MTTPGHAVTEVRGSTKAGHLINYVQLMLLVVAAGAIYPMLYLRQVYQSVMLASLGIENEQLGVLYSILGTAFLLGYLPSGWLADRIAPRVLISFSLLGTGMLGFWYATLPGYRQLLVIFCAFGLTTGLTFWAALLKRVKMLASEKEQGRFFGMLDGGRGLIEASLATIAISVFAATTHGDATLDAKGFSNVLHIYACTCVALGIVLAFIPDPKVAAKAGDSTKKDSARPRLLDDFKLLARIPELWLLTAIIFCGYHFFWATYSFSAYLETTGLGLTATAAAVITTIKLWMRPFGGIGGGWLGDKFSTLGVLMVAMCIAAVGLIGLIVLPALRHVGVLAVVVVMIGLSVYTIRGLYWAVLEQCNVPVRVTGLAIGLVSLLAYSPDVYLPLLNGWIIGHFPGLLGYQIYFTYVVIVGMCGVLAALTLRRRVRQRSHAA